MQPFEKLFDEVEELDGILSEGPGDSLGDSAEFLKNVQMEANEIARLANALTVADVDAEFTDESEDNDEQEQEAAS